MSCWPRKKAGGWQLHLGPRAGLWSTQDNLLSYTGVRGCQKVRRSQTESTIPQNYPRLWLAVATCRPSRVPSDLQR